MKLGKASSDQPQVALNGSGALSHVYIHYPPIRCNIPGIQGLYYDDGNKLLLAPTSDQILSWKVGLSAMLNPPNSDSIGEGTVLSIRYSLDGKVIGIQRSNHEIQFKNRETGETFIRQCRPDSERILGFFWTDCPSCDIIFIKTSGIDLLSYEPQLNTLRLVESKRLIVSWYTYTHESRMVLLASGMQCNIFYGFQFSSGGIIRLPRFEMSMAKAEANTKPVLSAEDIHLVTVYGRIYCLQLDRASMNLNFYRFYRDAVVQQGVLAVYSSRIAVSVIDNVLLVHQVDAKVVILYDIFLDSLSPISAPLPLLLRGSSCNNRQAIQMDDNISKVYGAMIYGASWTFLVPDLVCDVDNGFLWRICLDLEAIAASSSDVPSLLEFLQRRRSDPCKIKNLCLAIIRAIVLERRPISFVARGIDVLVASYSHSLKLESALQGGEGRNPVRTQQAGNQIMPTSKVVLEESSSRTMEEGKSVEVGDNDPQQSADREVEDDNVDHAAKSITNRASFRSVSDFGGDEKLDKVSITLGESSDNSLSGDLLISNTRVEMRDIRSFQISNADLEQSPVESEGVEHNRGMPGSCVSKQQELQSTGAAISPDEIYHFVFALVEEELGADPAYLVAVIVEFLHSVTKEKLKVHPNVYVMLIQLLVRTNRYSELALFVANKILEPSKEVALQLLESGRQNLLTRKLGTNMLRQLSLHHDFVTALLQDGCYLEALRYARKHKVITVRPALFLESAVAANNSQHVAAVLRFFSDFTPSFKSTSDFNRYCQMLTEMS